MWSRCFLPTIYSAEVPMSIWKYYLWLLFIFQLFTHKLFTTTLLHNQLHSHCRPSDGLELWSVCENPKTYIQHLCKYKCFGTFSKHRIAMCSIFIKTKHKIKPTSKWTTWENFWFFKPLCTRRPLMTQFANLDIEKNLQ